MSAESISCWESAPNSLSAATGLSSCHVEVRNAQSLTAAVTGPLFCSDTSTNYMVGCSNPIDCVSPVSNYKPRPDMHAPSTFEGSAKPALYFTSVCARSTTSTIPDSTDYTNRAHHRAQQHRGNRTALCYVDACVKVCADRIDDLLQGSV